MGPKEAEEVVATLEAMAVAVEAMVAAAEDMKGVLAGPTVKPKEMEAVEVAAMEVVMAEAMEADLAAAVVKAVAVAEAVEVVKGTVKPWRYCYVLDHPWIFPFDDNSNFYSNW